MMRLAIVQLGTVIRNIHLPAYARLAAKISLAGAYDVQKEAYTNRLICLPCE